MQSEMEKSSSLSALRQRVRDGVAESDFAGLARVVTHRGVWQAVAADPISCAYMAPVWAYGLAPAPGVDIFGRLERWCPALPAADYALGILYADGLCLPRNVHLARYHLQQGWQTEEQPVRTLTVQLSLAGQEDYLALQQEAGLPLADYDGQTVTRCTYTVTNYPGRTGDVQANLYLCGDVIVGGDIMALGENGFQASLLYPAENT